MFKLTFCGVNKVFRFKIVFQISNFVSFSAASISILQSKYLFEIQCITITVLRYLFKN